MENSSSILDQMLFEPYPSNTLPNHEQSHMWNFHRNMLTFSSFLSKIENDSFNRNPSNSLARSSGEADLCVIYFCRLDISDRDVCGIRPVSILVEDPRLKRVTRDKVL